MKKIFSLLMFVSVFALSGFAQNEVWNFTKTIHFPASDTAYVRPFLMTIDSAGVVYVASSKATTTKAHNAIYYLMPGDTVMKKMIDFDYNGDSDTLTGNIGAIRGITALNRDLLINASIPYPRTAPNTVASQYYYKNAETNQVEKFGFNINGSGYGTYIHGAALTKDTIVYAFSTFNTTIRFYNFKYGLATPARGSWISMATFPTGPGGPHFNGLDVVRDIALLRDGDYNNPETPWYTSRNSKSSTEVTGGIAMWTGGSQTNPSAYSGTKITDLARDLDFSSTIPYGIDVDSQGRLWVAGTDTTRRWVKAYNVIVNFADPVYELPGQFSVSNPNPDGAPMTSPSDVVLTKDARTAFVADAGTRAIYKFEFFDPTGIEDGVAANPSNFTLEQNFPNPFNPSTLIKFNLPEASNARLFITDMMGQQVAEVFNGYKPAGQHSIAYNGAGLTSGIYFYTLETATGRLTKKMMLMK